jgi:hypothetical protein
MKLINLIFPKKCVFCGEFTGGEAFCPVCAAKYEQMKLEKCKRCGEAHSACRCRAQKLWGERNVRARHLFAYEGEMAKSLIYKVTGEEMLATGEDISIFSLTQLRPFNNEVKLAYMNKRTTYQANKISVEGNKITVGFEIVPCQAIVEFDIKDDYIVFTLSDLIFPENVY